MTWYKAPEWWFLYTGLTPNPEAFFQELVWFSKHWLPCFYCFLVLVTLLEQGVHLSYTQYGFGKKEEKHLSSQEKEIDILMTSHHPLPKVSTWGLSLQLSSGIDAELGLSTIRIPHVLTLVLFPVLVSLLLHLSYHHFYTCQYGSVCDRMII